MALEMDVAQIGVHYFPTYWTRDASVDDATVIGEGRLVEINTVIIA